MYSDELSGVRTIQDQINLEERIQSELDGLYKTSGPIDPAKEKALKEALDTLKNLRIIHLTVAFKPSEEFVNRLHDWLAKTVGAGFVIDLDVNPLILGGVIVEKDGVYRDYSIKRRVDELLFKKV